MNQLVIKTSKFCDINIVNQTREEFAAYSVAKAKERKKSVSFSLNGESLANYFHVDGFRQMFSHANYVHADGMFIVLASRLLDKKNSLPERIATTDWFHDVARLSEGEGVSHYFLGGDVDTLKKTVRNLRKLYPKLAIAGYHHGYFHESEFCNIIADINKTRPHIVWVGLGRPKQEKIALMIRDSCDVGLIKTCGGLFDFLAGNNQRAPDFMQKAGLEWMYRLYLQPNRLFKRYIITNYQSIRIVLSYKFFGFYHLN